MITTIEGNTSRQVARRTYTWNDWHVAGYARPKYPLSEKSSNKAIQDIANEVIQGGWGNGEERITRLKNAGYDASAVQAEVNRQLKSKSNRKSNKIIAREVIQGKWGNGNKRKENLTKAGYNYRNIQEIVNRIM